MAEASPPAQGSGLRVPKRKSDDAEEGPPSSRHRKKGKQQDESLYDRELGSGNRMGHRLPDSHYDVGWICALYLELAAAEGMMDMTHDHQTQLPDDSNTYVLGTMAGHNVVIACLPAGGYGSNNAAVVATNMRRSFPSIRICLLVGIGGGVGDADLDLRLGDVVVSEIVHQYDMGKVHRGGRLIRSSTPHTPSHALRTAISRLKSKHELLPSYMSRYIEDLITRYPRMASYSHPGSDLDYLFNASYEHQGGPSCRDSCDKAQLVSRSFRSSSEPRIHYGTIASGNQVIKHGETRDRLAQELRNLCFEMEAAGLNDMPYVAIRGISDYSDSHKNDGWQRYAAATAAAYAKELLSALPRRESPRRPETRDQNEGSGFGSSGAQSRPSTSERGKTIQERVHRVNGLVTGNNGTQLCVAGGGEVWDLTDVAAGDGSIQFIGSTGGDSGMLDLLRSLARPRTTTKEEVVEQENTRYRRSS